MKGAVVKRKPSRTVYSDFRCLSDVTTNMFESHFGCGIALACGRFSRGQDAERNVWEEGFVALPSELAAELISWDAMRTPASCREQRRQEFMSWLGLHPDARLRALAAGEPGIVDAIVKKLAVDSAYAVRSALSQNPSLVASMKTSLAVSMVNGDADLIENLLCSMTEALEMKIRECQGMQGQRPRSVEDFNRVHQLPRELDRLRKKTQELIEIFIKHTDPCVRRYAFEQNARFKLLTESSGEHAVRHPSRRIRPSVFDFEGEPDEREYALVYLTVDEDGERVAIERYMGALPISLDALARAAAQLPQGAASDAFVLRLAGHPAAAVRAAVASRDGLPIRAVELLKKDKTHAVRRSLLNNEAVLMELSGEDVLGILANDASLLDETLGMFCPSSRINRVLKENLSESGDPYVREVVSRLED